MIKPNNPIRMHTWNTIFLFALALLIFGTASMSLKVPGYMDAEYYYMTGQTLASGKGFTEMVLWNYLDDPPTLPHPANTYWLPLTSILAAAGMAVFKNQQFFYAQIPFILLSGLTPIITYGFAYTLYADGKKALFAGILALFPGYYLVYMTTTSTILPFMVLGGLFFWLLVVLTRKSQSNGWRFAGFTALGVVAGLMHLTRAEGFLWLFGALLSVLLLEAHAPDSKNATQNEPRNCGRLAGLALCVLSGYLLFMGPWFLHNLNELGQLMPPGSLATLWIQDYDQLFNFSTSDLTFRNWIDSGLSHILITRLKSSGNNLLTLLAVTGEIILLPLFILGIMKFRKYRVVTILGVMWIFTFILMSWLFPLSGMRGGFLHSSAAFQSAVWVFAPTGFDNIIKWGVRKRSWKLKQASTIFSIGLCVLLATLSGVIYYSKVIGSDPASPSWHHSRLSYVRIESEVRNSFPDTTSVIIINNPPGYYLASDGRPAVVLPNGDEQVLRAVAERYNAQIVAVDRNTVEGLKHLYWEPESNQWLDYLFTVEDTRIYQISGSHADP